MELKFGKCKFMKLKEKFTTMVLDKDIADWEKECEQIADEFAIEFTDWCIKNNLVEAYVLSILYKTDYKYSIEELLETFKKEKGL